MAMEMRMALLREDDHDDDEGEEDEDYDDDDDDSGYDTAATCQSSHRDLAFFAQASNVSPLNDGAVTAKSDYQVIRFELYKNY